MQKLWSQDLTLDIRPYTCACASAHLMAFHYLIFQLLTQVTQFTVISGKSGKFSLISIFNIRWLPC